MIKYREKETGKSHFVHTLNGSGLAVGRTDIMTNHINSGMSKLFESLLITLALGAGTSVALVLMK